MTAVRVAAIDCGTNSLRLLVADIDPVAGTFTDVDRRMEVVRLGEGVDRTGELAPAALERAFDGFERYAAIVRGLGATAVRVVATSATRDARNRSAFVAGVRSRIGVPPEVVSGAEEAALSFAGAVRSLTGPAAGAGTGAGRAMAGPYLVFDIGGGSTEFVLGQDAPQAAASVDIGCVRLTERCLHSDPPDPAQVADLTAAVDTALDQAAAAVPLDRAGTLIGLAGTVTTVAALALGLPAYDPAAIHGARIPAAAIRRVCDDLVAMDHAARAALPVMHPGRVDVIVGGALILRRVVERSGRPDLVASEHDILDGIAWSLLRSRPRGGSGPPD